ncbi:MAG TPA: hypothetical protein VE569_11675 [Acidimicrobiia bacterium]|nr:hypothetical protein [Acidimicrobiia bacterium]
MLVGAVEEPEAQPTKTTVITAKAVRPDFESKIAKCLVAGSPGIVFVTTNP